MTNKITKEEALELINDIFSSIPMKRYDDLWNALQELRKYIFNNPSQQMPVKESGEVTNWEAIEKDLMLQAATLSTCLDVMPTSIVQNQGRVLNVGLDLIHLFHEYYAPMEAKIKELEEENKGQREDITYALDKIDELKEQLKQSQL